MGTSSPQRPPAWQTFLAFAIIYLVWGSTFLAIRIGVHEVPPFLLAAVRFLAAGIALCGWAALRGHSLPTARQWRSVAALSVLIFLLDYGLLFWAEQRVPSGLAAVMLATIPAFTALSEIVILRTRALTLRLAVTLLIGLAGVAVLVSRSLNLGGEPIDPAGAAGLTIASLTWSIASALARKLSLPASKVMNSGAQMLAGGAFLAIASLALGEHHGVSVATISTAAWLALLYLIVAGSIVGFTAYVWLNDHHSPTRVATYAYINPVVAVLIGHFFAGEELGLRTIVGALCVLVSVVLITTQSRRYA